MEIYCWSSKLSRKYTKHSLATANTWIEFFVFSDNKLKTFTFFSIF